MTVADFRSRSARGLEPPPICNRPTLDERVVKSAGRVLQILEFFDDIRRSATVIEVAETLGYPQSSTSKLLRSLHACGYLSYQRDARRYMTASRVALLGRWVDGDLVEDGPVLRAVSAINERTGHAVILATPNGVNAHYIHVAQASRPGAPHVTVGTVRPLAMSTAGHALLSSYTDAQITRIVTRIRSEAADPSRIVTVREMITLAQRIRSDGYVANEDLVIDGSSMVASPVYRWTGGLLAIGVCAPTPVLSAERAEIIDTLCAVIAAECGPSMLRRRAAG